MTKTRPFLSMCYGDPSATEVPPYCEAATTKLTFSTTSVLLLLNMPLSLYRGTIFRLQKNPRRVYRPKIAGILFVYNEPEGKYYTVPVCPYWAWNSCRSCCADRPPRAHHCPVCRACVLKRDHHCAFTGTCVGVRNQRHFVVFTFWVAVASFYSLAHALWYGAVDFLPRNSSYDLLLPLTVLRWGFGWIAAFDVVLMALFYSLVFFFCFSLYFFVSQITLVCEGLTSFESANGIKVNVSAATADNIRGVFGNYWLCNFILPLHHVFPCSDDGISWPKVKV